MNTGVWPPSGVVRGMSNEAYHAITEAISSSGLRRMARSPLHYYAQSLDPQRPVKPPSDAMQAGTLAHCALLEPDELRNRYAIKPEGYDGRTKEGKAWRASIPPEITVIEAEQLLTAQRQADAVRALPEVGPLLSRGAPEVSAFWTDKESGVLCKCRPDWVSPAGADGVVLPDLKTTQDASPEGFARSIWKYRYDIQAAFYAEGFEQASGLIVYGFVFLAVEADWPHAAAAYMLEDHALEKARADIRRLLAKYAECKASDRWPGYAETIQPISLPAWAGRS